MDRFNLILYIGREEQLIEAAMFWNMKKICNLPKYLKARLKKVRVCIISVNIICNVYV